MRPHRARHLIDITVDAVEQLADGGVLQGGQFLAALGVSTESESMRETPRRMAKAYAEARSQHGASELLDEIVSAKPKVDHTRYHSYVELKDHGLGVLRQAMTILSGHPYHRS